MALEYAKELRRDREILLAAFRKNPSVDMLNCYTSTYKEDRAFILALATIHGCRALWYASDELRADKDIILSAVSHDVRALRFVDDEVLLGDRKIILTSIAAPSVSEEISLSAFYMFTQRNVDFVLSSMRRAF